MKDSTGNAALSIIIVMIVGIVGLLIIASNMYSKSYRVKNSIINAIDSYHIVHSDITGYSNDCFDDPTNSCIDKINQDLRKEAYFVGGNRNNCLEKRILNNLKVSESDLIFPKSGDSFQGYCVFKGYNLDYSKHYYKIVSFSALNINAFGIGTLIKIPVYGETRLY